MMDRIKFEATIRELLELGGLLKTGELELTFKDETSDTDWVGVEVEVRPKKTTWNAALDQLPPQHPIMMRLLEWMSASEKIEMYRLFYVTIKRWTEPDSALPDDQREKLTAICEDTLEALSRAPKKSEEQPTPIVELNKKIDELETDIEEQERLKGRPQNYLAGYRWGLKDALKLFMEYWKTTGPVIYEIAGQCSSCGRVAPAHLLKPAADTGKSICMACIDDKRQALASTKSQEKIDAALEVMGSIDEETAEHMRNTMKKSRGRAPWLKDPKDADLDARIQLGKHHGGKNILVTIQEAEDMQSIRRIRWELGELLGVEQPPLWRQIIDAVKEAIEEPLELRHRVQTAMGRISTDDWDDMINTISGIRGKQLFELKRVIVQVKQKLKKEVARYQEDEGRALDAEERDEHDQHGAFIRGIRAALVFLDAAMGSKSQYRMCVICGKELLITPPKGPEELPVPGRVVCETCTKKATDPTREVDLEAGFGIITNEGKRVDVRPLLASICNCIDEIVYRMGSGNTQGTLQVQLKRLKERAERASLVLTNR